MAEAQQYIAHWEQEEKHWYGPFPSAQIAMASLKAAALGPEKGQRVKIALLFPPPPSQDQLKQEHEQKVATPNAEA